MVLLMLIVYVFAALFSQAIHDHMNSAGDSMDTEDIEAPGVRTSCGSAQCSK